MMSSENTISLAARPGDATERLTVFLFPGLSGDEREVAALRLGCGATVQFVPINYPDWPEIQSHVVDLDGLVSYCTAQVRAHAASTPAHLAGYSFGGHIAFAVTATLATSGYAVGALGLLDTHAVPSLWTERFSIAQQLRNFHAAVRQGRMAVRLGHIVAKTMMRSRSRWLLRSFASLRHIRSPFGINRHVDRTLQMQFRLMVLRKLLDRMATSPSPFDFDAVLFRCVDQPPNTADDLGWGRHLSRLRVEPVLGSHFSLMDSDNIDSLCNSFMLAMTDYPE